LELQKGETKKKKGPEDKGSRVRREAVLFKEASL